MKNQNQNLQNKIKKLNLEKIKMEDSSNYFKNKSRYLLNQNNALKSTKSYRLSTKFNNVKNKLS